MSTAQQLPVLAVVVRVLSYVQTYTLDSPHGVESRCAVIVIYWPTPVGRLVKQHKLFMMLCNYCLLGCRRFLTTLLFFMPVSSFNNANRSVLHVYIRRAKVGLHEEPLTFVHRTRAAAGTQEDNPLRRTKMFFFCCLKLPYFGVSSECGLFVQRSLPFTWRNI